MFYASMNACFQYPEIALRMWCLRTLNLQPATYGLVVTAAGIPWACKPLVGALVDVNKRRRLAVLVSALFTVFPWVFIAMGLIKGALGAGLCITLSSSGLCYMDITSDAILVKRVRDEKVDELGTMQSNCWIARAVGAILAGTMGGLMTTYGMSMGIENILGFTGVLIFPGAVALYLEAEDVRQAQCADICYKLKRVTRTLTSTALLRPCVFIFLLCSMPNCGNTLSAFFQTALEFSD